MEKIKQRDMVKFVLLSLLTAGIYPLYFYYKLSMDINAVCKGDGKESESYLVAVALSAITLGAYKVYWVYKLAQRLHVNAPRYDFKMVQTGKDIAVLDAFSAGYISAWELIKNMNKIAKKYNQSGLPEVVGGVQ